jgi:hypothetical protein
MTIDSNTSGTLVRVTIPTAKAAEPLALTATPSPLPAD